MLPKGNGTNILILFLFIANKLQKMNKEAALARRSVMLTAPRRP